MLTTLLLGGDASSGALEVADSFTCDVSAMGVLLGERSDRTHTPRREGFMSMAYNKDAVFAAVVRLVAHRG